MKDTIILYSGGMDSSVALYEYARQIRLALSFNYGSKHNVMEINYAKLNCDTLGLKHQIIELDFNKFGFVSDLLHSGDDIPTGNYKDETMRKTTVPFRNGIMLSIAAGIAESLNCSKILISNHAGDHIIYPDCRPEFIESMNEAINYGTYNHINILAPYTKMNKREIAQKGKLIGVPFEKTYSCYNGEEVHCGNCSTCLERIDALDGFDNTLYLAKVNK